MGSYEGHVLAGAFLIIFGLWWTVGTNLNYFYGRGVSTRQVQQSRNAQKREHELNKRSWLPFPCWPRFTIEPFLKVLLPLVVVFVELLVDRVPVNEADASSDLNETGTVATKLGFSPVDLSVTDSDAYPVERLQHANVHLFFVVSGIIDFVSMVVHLPRKTGQISFPLPLEWRVLSFCSTSEGVRCWMFASIPSWCVPLVSVASLQLRGCTVGPTCSSTL